MRQQINFYQEQFHAVDKSVSLNLVLIPGALVLVLLLITFVTYWNGARLDNELEAVSGKYERIQDEYDQLQQQLKQRVKSAALEREIKELQRELNRKQQTLRYLQGEGPDANQDGFSAHLTVLSEIDRDSIWLNRIEFDAGGSLIDLRGNTLKTDDVPRYLQDLGATVVFQGKPFSSFIILRREEGEPHVFLASTREEEALVLEQNR
jgi:hypothetical protein